MTETASRIGLLKNVVHAKEARRSLVWRPENIEELELTGAEQQYRLLRKAKMNLIAEIFYVIHTRPGRSEALRRFEITTRDLI